MMKTDNKQPEKGDWVLCNVNCFGILKHVFTKRFAPYDEMSLHPDQHVGDVHCKLGQYVIFVRRDGSVFKRNRVKFDEFFEPISTKDSHLLQKYIEQNKVEYEKFIKIEKTVYCTEQYEYHIPDGFSFEDVLAMFEHYRTLLPARFTIHQLNQICEEHNCPIHIFNYIRYGRTHCPQFTLVLYYPVEDFEGQDILFSSYKIFS